LLWKSTHQLVKAYLRNGTKENQVVISEEGNYFVSSKELLFDALLDLLFALRICDCSRALRIRLWAKAEAFLLHRETSWLTCEATLLFCEGIRPQNPIDSYQHIRPHSLIYSIYIIMTLVLFQPVPHPSQSIKKNGIIATHEKTSTQCYPFLHNKRKSIRS
jgi:hypothetical protein